MLVVDDDDDVRRAICQFLEDEECDAVAVGNGDEALRALRSGDPLPCLIFLDLMMPVMDGWQFRRSQLSDPALADIPVVVISAFGRDARSIDSSAFLPKPFRGDELMTFVHKFC